jgi:hypothetical protein
MDKKPIDQAVERWQLERTGPRKNPYSGLRFDNHF